MIAAFAPLMTAAFFSRDGSIQLFSLCLPEIPSIKPACPWHGRLDGSLEKPVRQRADTARLRLKKALHGNAALAIDW